MNAIIIKGSKDSKLKYIDKLISQEEIPAYNVNFFSETFKISDVRELIKKISVSSDKKRIYIIDCEPGLDSQNAMLKTLEELGDDTFIVFSGNSELLPTITSRCRIVNLELESFDINIDIDAIIDGDINKALVYFTGLLDDKSAREIIVGIRNSIVNNIDKYNNAELRRVLSFLKILNSKYHLISGNNLNKNLVFDSALIKCINV